MILTVLIEKVLIMKSLTGLFSVLAMATAAVQADDQENQELRKQVQDLTERVAKLEAIVNATANKPANETRAVTPQEKARERMRNDRKVYTQQQLQQIETLYQVANKKGQSDEGKKSLKELISKYDKANRTGCALVYLGQMSTGAEKEEYLKRAIADFSDCRYGDGVEVGPFARFLLAGHLRKNGQPEKADELLEEIKQLYPDAIDHRGKPLLESNEEK